MREITISILINTFLFLDQLLTQSGINLCSDQSPPPITFPALPIAILILLSFEEKKDLTLN